MRSFIFTSKTKSIFLSGNQEEESRSCFSKRSKVLYFPADCSCLSEVSVKASIYQCIFCKKSAIFFCRKCVFCLIICIKKCRCCISFLWNYYFIEGKIKQKFVDIIIIHCYRHFFIKKIWIFHSFPPRKIIVSNKKSTSKNDMCFRCVRNDLPLLLRPRLKFVIM